MASLGRWLHTKSRSGRRPISVHKLLDKERAGTLFKKHGHTDKIPGGLADKASPSDFPAGQLRKGIEVESEHTSDPAIAEEIAMDHLTEMKDYYDKLEKVEGKEKKSVATHDQVYLESETPAPTGLAAQARKRRSDVPSREDVDPNPYPKTESRGESFNTVGVGALTAPGGLEDLGKFSAAMETLGQMSRSWEVPSDDTPSETGSHHRAGSGGLIESPAPERTALDREMSGPFRFSLSEIGTQAAQDESDTKRASALSPPPEFGPPPRFPKADRMKDNTLDIQDFGSHASAMDPGSAPADGYSKTAMWNHQANCQHIFETAFHEELQKIAEANGGITPWVGEKLAFEQFVDSTLYKEALSLSGVRQGLRSAAGRLMPMAAQGAGPEVAAFRKGTGFFSTGIGSGLHQGGKMLAHNAPAAAQKAGLAAKDVSAMGAMRPTSMGRRIAGETAIGAGHHMEHAGAGLMAMNPVGVPMGGAIEGFTRGVGKEMQRAGNTAVQNAGHSLVRHAPKIGFGGEFLAGSALGAPGLGALAGHQLGAMAGHLGGAAAHVGHNPLVQHALGAGVQEASMGAGRMLPRMGQIAGNAMMGLKARAGHIGGKLVGA